MVYFVGAGPGAADLITVRGMRLLEKADVVIYAGSLVNPELLSYCKKECEIHNSAYMTLEEVLGCHGRGRKTKAYDRAASHWGTEHLRSSAGTDGSAG